MYYNIWPLTGVFRRTVYTLVGGGFCFPSSANDWAWTRSYRVKFARDPRYIWCTVWLSFYEQFSPSCLSIGVAGPIPNRKAWIQFRGSLCVRSLMSVYDQSYQVHLVRHPDTTNERPWSADAFSGRHRLRYLHYGTNWISLVCWMTRCPSWFNRLEMLIEARAVSVVHLVLHSSWMFLHCLQPYDDRVASRRAMLLIDNQASLGVADVVLHLDCCRMARFLLRTCLSGLGTGWCNLFTVTHGTRFLTGTCTGRLGDGTSPI